MSSEISSRSPLCHSHREEVANIITHGAGALLSVVALVGMMMTAWGNPLQTLSAAVFGISLILLYGFSTLYHFATTVDGKILLQKLDHASIYLLIAGSYTPVMLVALPGVRGLTLLTVVWVLAIAGVIIKTAVRGRKDHWISTALYVVMGWLILFVFAPLVRAVPFSGVAWLVAGGLSYTSGVIFYQWRKLPYHHAIWHLFVLGGSACHVIAVWFYVLR